MISHTADRHCRVSTRILVFALCLVSIQTFAASTMRVHAIDVGQGAATLLEFSCGSVLIDTGGEKNDEIDSTEMLVEYLDNFFEHRPDLGGRLTSLVLTHPHSDHTRGVKAVLKHFGPRHAVTNGQTYGSGKWGQIALHEYTSGPDKSDDTGDDIPFVAVTQERIDQSTGLATTVIDPLACDDVDPRITALWGQMQTVRNWGKDRYGKPHFRNNNNHSVVLRIDFGNASLLITGDMEENAIGGLVEQYKNSGLLDVDVYHVGHHGSINGTTRELLNAVTPRIALISMGSADRETSWTAWAYGHPRKEILDMLDKSVSLTRKALTGEAEQLAVLAGSGGRSFTNRTVKKAIFATGWDGDIVLEATTEGNWSIVRQDSEQHRINVNLASYEQLLDLPGIGPTKAKAIVDYRTTNGSFASVNELEDVPGIGPATLAGIKPHVAVE